VSQDQRQLCVDTARGQVRADRVIDTRPRPIPEGTLLQHFFGWEIETDKDVFDPTTVTLMDFSASTEEDVHFFYVLPFSSRRALVETTHFSKQQLCEAQYKDELRGYLRQRFALSNWHICSSEGGILPMPKRPSSELEGQPDVAVFGLHGDTVKPSSGYCYPHAQQQAEGMAEWLSAGANSGPPAARHSVARWFDAVFVTFLENRPAQAPAVFFRLFQRVKPAALVRFLSDGAQFADYLRVIWAMPKAVMMREALRYALGR
jgi:lycopene beta-cyclase